MDMLLRTPVSILLLVTSVMPLFSDGGLLNQDTSGDNSYSPSSTASVAARRISVISNTASRGMKYVFASKGDTVILRCEFRVSGWYTVRWVRLREDAYVPNELPTDITSTNNSVSIATLESVEEHDRANYTCVLSSLGDSTTYTFQVVVKEKLSCEENTCSQNGRCTETANGFTCVCQRGFIGKICELADPCLRSPCLNGGNCSANSTGGFICKCATGFNGTLCESEACMPSTCTSGGTCRVKDGRRTCDCHHNQAGNRCQFTCRFESYDSNDYNYRYNHRARYCRHGKTCKLSSNGLRETCVCDNNRRSSAHRCMMESDVANECANSNTCKGHGSCVDQVFGFRCACHSYYHGTNCEFYNECSLSNNKCRHYGGRCVDLVDGYKCTDCPNGQYGDKCQYQDNPCKVTCGGRSMTATCDTKFLSSKIIVIAVFLNQKTGSCKLSEKNGNQRSITISYDDCGTVAEYGDDYVIYRNRLRTGNYKRFHEDSKLIITRAVGHFQFDMECRLPLLRNASARLSDYTLLVNETKDFNDSKDIDPRRTNVEIYDSSYASRIRNFQVGDRLYVKMTIDTNSNPTLSRGYKLHPVTCYAAPDGSKNSLQQYTLIENGCILDETFRIENFTGYRSDPHAAYFSFESFTFKSYPGQLSESLKSAFSFGSQNMMHLYCTSRVCLTKSIKSENPDDCAITCQKAGKDVTIGPIEQTVPSTVAAYLDDLIERKDGPSVKVFTPSPL